MFEILECLPYNLKKSFEKYMPSFDGMSADIVLCHISSGFSLFAKDIGC